MFLPYKISDKTVDILTSYSYEEEYKKISEAVLKQRSKEELRKVLIDGSKLQEDWFPTKNLHFDEKPLNIEPYFDQEHVPDIHIRPRRCRKMYLFWAPISKGSMFSLKSFTIVA